MRLQPLCILPVALLAAVPASAQTIVPLVLQGDSVAGIGLVTGIQRVAINDNGDWVVEVDTDNANTALDEVILKNGTLYQQQGIPIAQPAGASLNDFLGQSLRTNNADVAFIWSLNGTAGGTTDNQGVYMNQQLVIQKGTTPMGAVWNPGTVYSSFSWAKLNTANQLCLRGFNNDPISTPTNDYYVSIIQLDGANNPVSETVAAQSGQILPGQVDGVNTVRTSQDSSGFNNLGHVIYGVSLVSTAPTATNSIVYLWDGSTNTLLAQKGMPSPVAGRNWSDLLSPEMALNDAGDWLIKDKLDGAAATADIIAKNGAKFIQGGDTLPSIGGVFAFTSFVNAPVSLTNAGNVCWYGDWNDPVLTVDTGIFLDYDLLVQEGVTTNSNGFTFNALLTAGISATAGQNNLLYVSPNGRYVIFSARQSNNVFGAFLLDRGLPITSFCSGDGSGTACPCANAGGPGRGCANSVDPTGAVLTTTGSGSVSSADLVLVSTGMGNSSCLFFQGTTQVAAGAGAIFGDGLRCAGGNITRLGTKQVFGGTASFPGAGDPSIAVKGMIPVGGGVTDYYQCWYRNAGPFCTSSTFNLTNGIAVPWVP